MITKSLTKLTLFALLLTGGSQSWASPQDYFAKCNLSTNFFGEKIIYIPSFFSGANHVAIKSLEGLEKIDASVSMFSWVTFIASFNYQEQSYSIEASNYISPSIATMTVDGVDQPISCQLNQEF